MNVKDLTLCGPKNKRATSDYPITDSARGIMERTHLGSQLKPNCVSYAFQLRYHERIFTNLKFVLTNTVYDDTMTTDEIWSHVCETDASP